MCCRLRVKRFGPLHPCRGKSCGPPQRIGSETHLLVGAKSPYRSLTPTKGTTLRQFRAQGAASAREAPNLSAAHDVGAPAPKDLYVVPILGFTG